MSAHARTETSDAPRDGRITYWKGQAQDLAAALKLVQARADAERAEWRADRETWEAEQDALWQRIVQLRESRALAIGWAVACSLFALVALVARG